MSVIALPVPRAPRPPLTAIARQQARCCATEIMAGSDPTTVAIALLEAFERLIQAVEALGEPDVAGDRW